MKKVCFLFSAFLLVLLIHSSLVLSADWPQWRGPNRDGKSPDTGLLKEWPRQGPPLVWKASGIGEGFSSPAIVGDTVFITGKIGDALVITALDRAKGTEKWKKPHGPAWERSHPGSRATPTVMDGKLYLMSGFGHLACYEAESGERKWAVDVTKTFGGQPPNWGYAESVLILKDLAIVTPGGRNCIVALKTATGKLAWASKGLSDSAAYSSCIAFEHKGATMIANMTSEGMVCINAKTGGFLWRCNRAAGKTAVCPTPVYSDGYVFGASGYGNGGACVKLSTASPAKGTQVWDTTDMVCHHGGFVVVDGYIYGNHEGGWSCLDLKTGKKMWEDRGVGKGAICYADGMLYTYSESGGQIGLVPATPKGFKLVSQFSVQGRDKSWAHPVVIDGCLYLRYDDNLYVFDVKAK